MKERVVLVKKCVLLGIMFTLSIINYKTAHSNNGTNDDFILQLILSIAYTLMFLLLSYFFGKYKSKIYIIALHIFFVTVICLTSLTILFYKFGLITVFVSTIPSACFLTQIYGFIKPLHLDIISAWALMLVLSVFYYLANVIAFKLSGNNKKGMSE